MLSISSANSWKAPAYAYENVLYRAACAAIFCFLMMLLIIRPSSAGWFDGSLATGPNSITPRSDDFARDKANVPTMGGVMILTTIAAAVLLFSDLTNFYVKMGLVCLFWLGCLADSTTGSS